MTAVLEQPATVIPVVLPSYALRNALAACVLAARKPSDPDGPLPVLEAVHVAKTGDKLVFRATDRYRLTTVTVDLYNSMPEGDWETLIPLADAKRAVSTLPKRDRAGQIATIAPDAIDFLNGDDPMRFTPVDGAYPRTDHVVKSGSAPTEKIGLNPRFLVDLGRMPGRAPNEPAVLEFNGANKPVVSRWTDDKYGCVSYLHVVFATRLP